MSAAVAALTELDSSLRVSPLYETAPVGGPPGQGRYLNCVVELHTSASPRDLLEVGQRLEQAAHRVRTTRDGPRTLDVDVLLVDDLVVNEKDLVVPHPRMYERAFVLAPLEDLDPALVPVGWRAGIARSAHLDEDVTKVGTLSGS